MEEIQLSPSIDLTWELPWETHFCLFYPTKKDLIDVIGSYFKVGLESFEFCIWVIPEFFDPEEAKKALRNVVPDFNNYLEKEQIEIISYASLFEKNEVFNPKRLLTFWSEKLNQAHNKGFSGLRLAQDIFWIKEKGENFLVEYEKEFDKLILSSQIIAFCTYSPDKYNSFETLDIIGAHEFSLIKKKGGWARIESSSEWAVGINTEAAEYKPAKKAYNNSRVQEQTFDRMDRMSSYAERKIEIEKRKNTEAALKCTLTSLNLFITEVEKCKIAESALQKSTDRLLIAKEAVELGIHDYDLVSGTIQWDSQIRELWGVEPDESITYELFMEGIHPEDRAPTQKAVDRALDPTGDGKYYAEYRIINFKDRVERWIAANGQVFFEYGLATRLVGTVQDITERKRADEALLKSEAKYRQIVETAQEGIWLIDGNDQTVFVNQKMSEMLGYSIKEMIGQPPQKFMRQESLAKVNERLHEHMQGVNHVIDHKFIRKDGSDLWSILSSHALFDEQGKYTGSLTMITDITKRKKAEQELFNVNQRLEALMNALPLGVSFSYDPTCQTITGNPALLAQFEARPEDNLSASSPNGNAPGRQVRYFLNGRQLDNIELPLQRAVAEERQIPLMEIEVELPNGHRWVAEASAAPIHDKQGNVVGGVAVTTDITERKRAEEKIKILANAVESSNDAIITESLEGVITSWNKGAEQIYGYSAEEVLGKNISVLEPADLKGEMCQLIAKIKNNEKVSHYETVRLKKDNTLVNISVTFSPIFSTSGELIAVSGISRDITERVKAERALAKIEAARLKEIHHRIKNNLQVISSLLDLQAGKFQEREVIEAFKESQDRVISMALIHEELYRGNGIDSLNFSAYLRKLAENLFQTYSLRSKNISLSMDLGENAFLNMDIAIPLGIIVNELISNSLKHAFSGNEDGKINVKLSKEKMDDKTHKSLFNLIISDNGNGISQDIKFENPESLDCS